MHACKHSATVQRNSSSLVIVQMATSAVLWGAGDVLAQRVAEGKASKDIDKRRVGLTSVFGLSFMGPVGFNLACQFHAYPALCHNLITTKSASESNCNSTSRFLMPDDASYSPDPTTSRNFLYSSNFGEAEGDSRLFEPLCLLFLN
eukprot:1137770-Pelagomonas_calceolata.AAC.19